MPSKPDSADTTGLGNQNLLSEVCAPQELAKAQDGAPAETPAPLDGNERDDELGSLVAAWLRIPSHIKAGVVAMVQAVLEEDSG